ncbi:M56 family metallopeptidase [Ornithinimicrobium panacihumi]|uniref:M56 family metallopeptidase n=1 Tax=Ornithinimicrobium panacihumi TaxID=2008449 RepID=UPI003F894ADC
MTPALVTAALIGGALVHTLLLPRLLTRWTALRRAPGEALALWQAVSLTGVVCALLAAPVAALTFGADRPRLLAAALVVSGLMLLRLLLSGHRIGTDLRRMRARQRELIDLVGDRSDGRGGRIAVVAHASPAAYCLPGRRDRIVLSQGAVDQLDDAQLDAVLAHEHAHLRQRHDLLLELFTVLHESVPGPLRAPGALREVGLLAEILADRAATTTGGAAPRDLAHALVTMAEGTRPATPAEATSAPGTTPYPVSLSAGHQVTERLQAIAAPEPGMGLRTTLLLLALGALATPWMLVSLLFVQGL